jgi:phenylacetate-CoA ligase
MPSPAPTPSHFALALRGAALLARLRLHEGWSEARIRMHQDLALRRLVTHAATHVRHYRELFRSLGLQPGDIRSRDDLGRLPVLTRATFREHADDLISDLADRSTLVPCRSSGSTGEPVTMWLGPRDFIDSWGFWAYGLLRSGGRPFDRYASLEFRQEARPRRRTFFERMGIFRTESLDLRAPVEETRARLERLRPEVLYGFPSCLHLLAHHVLEHGTTYRPRLVLTHGEVLPPAARELVGRALGCPVRDTYGSTEVFRIACECAHGRLHVLPDSAIVELDPTTRQPDGSGDVLITPLYLRTMPLLRYRLGDQLVLAEGPCRCGSSFQGILAVTGRSDDWITLPGGRRITGRHVRPHRIASLEGVVQFRIIQRLPDLFEVLVLPGPSYGPGTATRIEQILRESCAPTPVQVQIRLVRDLPRGGTGKHRAVVSEVPAGLED